jgi:hypothetical protein
MSLLPPFYVAASLSYRSQNKGWKFPFAIHFSELNSLNESQTTMMWHHHHHHDMVNKRTLLNQLILITEIINVASKACVEVSETF